MSTSERFGRADAEKVLLHLHRTLTASIDFFANMAVHSPDAYTGYRLDLVTLHTDIEEHWGASESLEEDLRDCEAEQSGIREGLATMRRLGADTTSIEADIEVERELTLSAAWDTAEEGSTPPPGWPLDY